MVGVHYFQKSLNESDQDDPLECPSGGFVEPDLVECVNSIRLTNLAHKTRECWKEFKKPNM